MLIALANPVAVQESNQHLRLIRSATDWAVGTSMFTLQFGTAALVDGQVTEWVPSAFVPTVELSMSLVSGSWAASGLSGTLTEDEKKTLLVAMRNVQDQISVLAPWALANLSIPELKGATQVVEA